MSEYPGDHVTGARRSPIQSAPGLSWSPAGSLAILGAFDFRTRPIELIPNIYELYSTSVGHQMQKKAKRTDRETDRICTYERNTHSMQSVIKRWRKTIISRRWYFDPSSFKCVQMDSYNTILLSSSVLTTQIISYTHIWICLTTINLLQRL